MDILKNIKIIDLALKIEDNLIIADTHIGFEEALNKQGILVPRFQFKELIQRLEGIFKALYRTKGRRRCKNEVFLWRTSEGNIKNKGSVSLPLKNNNDKQTETFNEKLNNKKLLNKIIINGDIKHEFGTISDSEWRHTIKLLDFLKKYTNEIILIKGNHDKILGPIAEKKGIKIADHYKISDILIIHGDKIPAKTQLKGVKTIIIGHEHPAISIREGARAELFKCFLRGKWKSYNIIVQPSFNLVTEGTDVLKEEVLSPFLKQNLNNFEIFIAADKTYRFGKLRNLK